MSRDRAAWELVLEAAEALSATGDGRFTRAALLAEVRRRDPNRRDESVGPVIQGMTVNAPGGPTSPCGTPLRRVAHGVYELVDPPSPGVTPAADLAAAERGEPADVVLVGCVRAKAAHPSPARSLYQSPLFARRRQYAETRGRVWYVLSAEHGLVRPETILEPYDLALAYQPEGYRRAWAQWVVAKLERLEGCLEGRRIEIHAGNAYAGPLLPLLWAAGARAVHLLAGLRPSEQLAWYDRFPPAGSARRLINNRPMWCAGAAHRGERVSR